MNNNVKYVYFGVAEQLFEELRRGRRAVFITDCNVWECWAEFFEGREVVVMGTGECSKTIAEYERLAGKLLEIGVDRGTLLVGVGGGIVSDMVGFLGASYMRGASFGFISTTLLGQIDASVGGKNGVNVAGYKNMLGLFCEPEFVIIDERFLGTLPSRERSAAWGEVLKYALLMGDLELSDDAESIRRCVEYKLGIVEADLRDRGVRHTLNLGHTFAHAVERLSGGEVEHGEAVALGLVLMARMSLMLGLLGGGVVSTIEQMVASKGLMVELPEGVLASDMVEVMWGDKKRVGGELRMVLLEGIGRAVVRSVNQEELEAFFRVVGTTQPPVEGQRPFL